jgi:hypothetical protein
MLHEVAEMFPPIEPGTTLARPTVGATLSSGLTEILSHDTDTEQQHAPIAATRSEASASAPVTGTGADAEFRLVERASDETPLLSGELSSWPVQRKTGTIGAYLAIIALLGALPLILLFVWASLQASQS